MPTDQLFYTDGVEIKNITLPQYPDSAWTWYSGKPADDNQDYYASVAAVYRAANLTADVMGSVPFRIVNEAGDEVDNSNNYQNYCGFMPNPREILRLWRLSLFMTNKAYGFMEGNKVIKSLRYIAPDTITKVKISQSEGIIGFERTIQGIPTYYPVEDNRIFWMFRRDHTTELLASENTEFKALMNAAGVLYYSDEHLSNFFKRGGIKPHLLKVNGVPTREDREKIESWWDKLMRGLTSAVGKVLVADSMEAEPIGEGAESFKDSELHREKIEDVAIAAGIPISLLLSNSANYATARVEYASWFNNSVTPWAEFIEENLNEKLFRPAGLRFKFTPDVTDAGTQEEEQRAGAYAALVASNIKPSVAAQMLSYELPPNYEDYSQLDDDYYEMLAQKAAASAVDMPQISEPKPPKDQVNPDIEKAPTPKTAPTLLTIDQLRELELWQSFAFRKLKRGESLDFPFVCKEIPEHVATEIRERLPECKTDRDIERAFKMDAPKREDDSLKELAAALNKAVEATMGDRIETKPTPKEDESKDDFMERCIPQVLEDGTAESNEQAVAVCNSMWEERNKDEKTD